MTSSELPEKGPQRLYCHCVYAKVIPDDVKREVLAKLSASGHAFDTVPDLCEMSARRDPALKRLSEVRELKIAACFPRAVKWLFHAAETPLNEDQVRVVNMRELSAEEVVKEMLSEFALEAEPPSHQSQEKKESSPIHPSKQSPPENTEPQS